MAFIDAKSSYFAAIILVLAAPAVFGQVTSSTASGRNAEPPSEAAEIQRRADRVLRDAGISFRQGLLSLNSGNKQLAKADFDKATETFLMAEVRTPVLTSCYNQMVETIFRLEFPSKEGAGGRNQGIAELSRTCGWIIEGELSASVASSTSEPVSSGTEDGSSAVIQAGFSEQKHEVSPLDELAKIVLNPNETNLADPTSQQQYKAMEQAVANNSLEFSFQVHPLIQQFINYYQGRGRQTMATGLYRSGMFMRMARRIFKKVGVPGNVAWLGQVESAWKPTAMSWASASGLWQFIPGTGARFGLRRNSYVDERNSFEKATEASARYLKFLANRYGGNWELALAAYNSGEGNVDRAIARAGVANFWAAYPYLPQETRNYVPSILATIIIANNPGQYGFGHVRPAAPLLYDRVKVPPLTSLGFIAQAADTTVEYLRYLNPELRTNSTPPESYEVRVPPTKGDEVVAMFKRLVPSGGDSNFARVEQVPTIGVLPVARTTSQRPAAPQPFVTVTVRAGDNLSKIAKKYGVSAKELANLNGLSSADAVLKVGTELKIPSK